jgi:hypothetical protein
MWLQRNNCSRFPVQHCTTYVCTSILKGLFQLGLFQLKSFHLPDQEVIDRRNLTTPFRKLHSPYKRPESIAGTGYK